MRPTQPACAAAPKLEEFDLSTLPPEVAARLDSFRKRVESACTRIAAARREIADAHNEIETVLKEHADLVAETESQASKLGQRKAALKRFLDIDMKQSRLKYSGVRLINSEEYAEADEKRTRAGAYERVEELARRYSPDVPEDTLEEVLLKEVKQYLDAALDRRFRPHEPPARS